MNHIFNASFLHTGVQILISHPLPHTNVSFLPLVVVCFNSLVLRLNAFAPCFPLLNLAAMACCCCCFFVIKTATGPSYKWWMCLSAFATVNTILFLFFRPHKRFSLPRSSALLKQTGKTHLIDGMLIRSSAGRKVREEASEKAGAHHLYHAYLTVTLRYKPNGQVSNLTRTPCIFLGFYPFKITPVFLYQKPTFVHL